VRCAFSHSSGQWGNRTSATVSIDATRDASDANMSDAPCWRASRIPRTPHLIYCRVQMQVHTGPVPPSYTRRQACRGGDRCGVPMLTPCLQSRRLLPMFACDRVGFFAAASRVQSGSCWLTPIEARPTMTNDRLVDVGAAPRAGRHR